MKKSIIIVTAVITVLFACKKREENPASSTPNGENVRIKEIIDSNITRDSLEMQKRFYYDAQGRITKIESFGRYPSVENYSYENGLLSSISSTRSDGSRFTRTFERENRQIRRVLHELNGTINYTDTYLYDTEVHLLQWIEKGQNAVGDTTYYSEFAMGRYSRSYKSFRLKFPTDSVPKKTTQRELKNFDEEGRIVSNQQTLTRIGQIHEAEEPKYGDSSGTETRYDYFPLSKLQRGMAARQSEINKSYYSNNLDVLDQVLDPSLSLPDLYQSGRRTYSNGNLIEQTTSIIEKSDGLGLPISILTTDPGETRDYPYVPRPASQTRRTIRYEVD